MGCDETGAMKDGACNELVQDLSLTLGTTCICIYIISKNLITGS